ncbi:hypothetical protein PAMP_017171 [Pampus punctatissimus]
MISMSCILALGLFSCALCRDVKRQQTELNTDEDSLEKSELIKRSAGLNEQTCTSFPGVESSLQNNTHTGEV